MLNTAQIVARLKDAKVRNVDVAKALGLPDSRVPEIYRGERALKLEEAVKLVAKFKLDEPAGDITPLSTPIARLLVLHVALELGLEPDPDSREVLTLAQDLRAFALLAADRSVRDSIQTADGFLRGIRARRRGTEASGQPGNQTPGR